MVEWYENRREGVEQGFTLAARPAGRGPLRIEANVADDLRMVAGAGGDAVSFLDPSGAPVLRCVRSAPRRPRPRCRSW